MLKWLFLVHQIHTPNSKERVKVWRAIRKTGAVLYRNSVYVLPYSKERLEDFQWVCQEIADSKGEASVFLCSAHSGTEDQAIQALFGEARKQDYTEWIADGERLLSRMQPAGKRKAGPEYQRATLHGEMKQLREKLDEIRKIDFFPDTTATKALQLMEKISVRLSSPGETPDSQKIKRHSAKDFQKKVWTTRENIHIDRVCSAWLIRRFIDPAAKFCSRRNLRCPATQFHLMCLALSSATTVIGAPSKR